MAKLLKLRRGTTSEHNSFTGAEGEVTVDTTKDTLVVHDGSTQGGVALAKESDNLSLIDEDDMATNSATRPPSQQSVKAYADTKAPAILDEDNLGSDSATRPPSQQSVKAYVDGQTLTLIDEDNLGSDSATRPPSQQSVKAYIDTNFAPKASPALTGTATGVNLTLSGDLIVNGTTTTVASSTMTVADKNIEIAKGAANDAAADGGGITLESGDGNKEIKWVNATDAWTFNQNIEITSGKNLTVDGTTFFVDATNNWVGIGTTSPTGSLSIASGTYQSTTPLSTADDIVISGNQSLGISLITAAAGTSNNTIAFGDTDDTDIGMIRYAHADNSLQFTTNASEQMRIDSSGRLLLGTTTEGSSGADELTINTASGHGGMTIRNDSSSNGNIWFSDGTSGAAEYAGYVQYDHSADALKLASGAALALTLDNSQNATFAGTVSDSKGDLRKIIQNTQGSTYTLVAADAGKHILASGNITVPDSVFSAGDAITIINNTGSNLTITKGTNLYNTGDGTNANRTLATRGMATLLFTAADTSYISGAGLS